MRRAARVGLVALLCVAAAVHAQSDAAPAEVDAVEADCVEAAAADDVGVEPVELADAADDSVERIHDFHSRVVVDAAGALTVSETISVEAAGERIKRGIYREFPTLYEDGPYWTRRGVPFSVVSVERDGRPEPFHVADADNGVRVYVGDAEVEIPHGRHTYTVTYRTDLQLGFFADHDELYWNATGNGWMFPIDQATASVELPAAVPRDSVRLEGYTGAAGETGHDLSTAVGPDGVLRFETTKALGPYAGLTIVASFAKGIIAPPTDAQRRDAWLRANRHLVAGAAGLGVVLVYYLATWLAVGRDPRRGTIIPLFEPPIALDAPGVRYVRGMGYDPRCFTAGLVSLAVKGWVRIDEKDGDFALHKLSGRTTPLSVSDRRLHAALFGGADDLELQQKNHGRLRAAIEALKDGLALDYETKMFRANQRWMVPGLVLSVLVLLTMAWFSPGPGIVLMAFILIWLSVWSFACLQLLDNVRRGWRDALRPGISVFSRLFGFILAIIVTAFALPFFAGEVAGFVFMTQAATVWAAPVAIALAGLNWLFLNLLKQPTRAGQALMDQIDGFRMYLLTAEGDELRQAPAKTPAIFERMLPYAIALGVEHEWSARFDDVLRRAGRADDPTYRPIWYSGSNVSALGAAGFTSMVGSSLSSAVASSSTSPGSSSGSSGGGSSGGGGGGGGGGGW